MKNHNPHRDGRGNPVGMKGNKLESRCTVKALQTPNSIFIHWLLFSYSLNKPTNKPPLVFLFEQDDQQAKKGDFWSYAAP